MITQLGVYSCSLMLINILLKCHAMEKPEKQTHKDVPTVIREKGYPCEEHEITTEDGYILTLHRIPYGRTPGLNRKRTPIFLQHGLLSSSASWTLDLPIRTPAFIFADYGYDVWMGNARGNVYSRKHTKLNPSQKEYWQFSFDEMGYYDIPAAIDYVLKTTGYSQLYYAGHSMGTTMFFAGMSRRPEYNSKIKHMFALAPVAKVSHIHRDLSFVCPWNKYIQEAFETVGEYQFLCEKSTAMKVIRKTCDRYKASKAVCEAAIFTVVGFDWAQFKEAWMPIVLDELLSGTSIYTVLHYAQENVADKFQRFDYRGDNMKIYGQRYPPEYNLSNVTAPVTLISSANDYLAVPQDVQFLIDNLPNVKNNWLIKDKSFNHLDFLWAIDSYLYVYNPILKEIGHF